MKYLRLLPAAIVVLLIGIFALLLLRDRLPLIVVFDITVFDPAAIGAERDPLVGQPVPEFDLAVLDGRSGYDPDTVSGPYLLNIWGSWCPPCVAEHPVLMALEAEGIAIYGIAWRDSVANANAFLDQRGDPFAGVLRDPMGEAVIALGVTGAPETFVVGRDGLIRARWAGPLTAEALERVIYPALEAG